MASTIGLRRCHRCTCNSAMRRARRFQAQSCMRTRPRQCHRRRRFGLRRCHRCRCNSAMRRVRRFRAESCMRTRPRRCHRRRTFGLRRCHRCRCNSARRRGCIRSHRPGRCTLPKRCPRHCKAECYRGRHRRRKRENCSPHRPEPSHCTCSPTTRCRLRCRLGLPPSRLNKSKPLFLLLHKRKMKPDLHRRREFRKT